MLKYFIFLGLLLFTFSSFAKKDDSLFVVPYKNGWAVHHAASGGENIITIAAIYYLPPAMLADANSIGFQQQLLTGTEIIIPLGAYNLLKERINDSNIRPVYVKVAGDPLSKIAKTTGVNPRRIQDWNSLPSLEVKKGQVLLIGWMRFNKAKVRERSVAQRQQRGGIIVEQDSWNNRHRGHTEIITITQPDTLQQQEDTLSEGEQQFRSQTHNGTAAVEEKGAAAFFKGSGRSDNGIYFAFHNTARRGTIIKIYSPVTDKTVYARVIGTIPTRDIFHNAILGLSSDARVELETGAEKVWCEISYAP